MGTLELLGFGPAGWGRLLAYGAGVTVLVSISGFFLGSAMGVFWAFLRLSRHGTLRAIGIAYTTILRGVPDLLVIYLMYFGGSMLLTGISNRLGYSGFVGMPTFLTGAVAIATVSAAYQAEVFRGAFHALNRGEIEAGRSVGMAGFLLFRRIIAPQVVRYALPGLANTWQLTLKESALISVVGLVELARQAQVGAGSTGRPFEFFTAAAVLYLLISVFSGGLFRWMERSSERKMGTSA